MMLKKNLQKLFFVYILIISGTYSAQQKLDAIDSIVKQNLKEFKETGIVIGVFQNGKENYYAYGTKKVNGVEKLNELTLFEIGSATKTFTSLLLAKEIEKGKIGINDYIDKYYSNEMVFPCEIKNRVLITDLATHQSGLPNLSNDNYFSDLLLKDPLNPFRFVDADYLCNVLRNTKSLENHRQYQYNNYAFALLGNILERENNMSYEDLIMKFILEPLKMENTIFGVSQHDNVAGLYSQRGEIQQPMILNKVNPAGGLKSNAVDLIKYLKYYLNSGKSNQTKIIQRTYYEDANRTLGLGWEKNDEYYQKDGDTFGNSCLIRYSPKHNTAIVVLSNHQNGELVRDIMDGIYFVKLSR